MTKLRIFNLPDYSANLPHDIFHLFPSNIEYIDIPFDLTHFKYLQLHPRSNLQLNELSLTGINFTAAEDFLKMYQLLPNHTESVSFGEINLLALIYLLENLQEVTKPTKLKVITINEVSLREAEEIDDIPEEMDDLDYFIFGFRVFGIELQVDVWNDFGCSDVESNESGLGSLQYLCTV